MRHLLAFGPVQRTRANDRLKLPLDAQDLFLQGASVGLDLRFTRTTKEAATTALTLQVGPAAHQAALLIGQVREFNLQRTLFCLGAAAEDFENEPGPVKDLGIPFFFEIALLYRRQGVIDDHELRVRSLNDLANCLLPCQYRAM